MMKRHVVADTKKGASWTGFRWKEALYRTWHVGLLSPLIGVCILSSQPVEDTPPPSQAEPPSTPPNEETSTLGEAGLMNIRTLLVDDFEDAGAWVGEMPRDNGIIVVQRRQGGPAEIRQQDPIKNQFSLGSKVSFFKTGFTHFSVKPPREIEIPGIVKTLSVWVAGRNSSHVLFAVVRSMDDKIYKIRLGDKMNFAGWTKLTGKVPQTIMQDNFRLAGLPGKRRGLSLMALYVECAMQETVGTYYFYVDQLEVESDMFLEDKENEDADDMVDDW